MNRIKPFQDFINESIKYLNQKELFDWLYQRRNNTFVAVDTETTGLRGPRQEQLTQIGAIAFSFDYDNLKFTELESFNEKIRLNPDILAQLDQEGSRIRQVFGMTRYEIKQDVYREEQEVLDSFIDFIGKFDNITLLIQNAPFDMRMINLRTRGGKLTQEIFDTKDFYAYFLLPSLQKLAETNEDARKILEIIGTSRSGNLPTSSLPKVAAGLGFDANEAHDALFDCRYMVAVLEKSLNIIQDNSDLDIKDYQRQRFATDRYLKLKSKGKAFPERS